jgi:tetratricopeptide (TPR) repeat protein
MGKYKPESSGDLLQGCQEELARAMETKDKIKISQAKADLGYALFGVRKYEEGMNEFDDSLSIARELGDLQLQVQTLGIKTLALQAINRLPDAYSTAEEVLQLGEEQNNPGLRCDAFASQGQILLDSGEPAFALAKLKQAQEIAIELEDKHRQMNILGAMGTHSLATASINQAQAYFESALGLANELEDTPSKIGYTGNVGAALAWQGKHQEAIPYFEQVLSSSQNMKDLNTEIQVLRHLAESYSKLGDKEKVLDYAQKGLAIAKDNRDDTPLLLSDLIIETYYHLDKIEDAHQSTLEAIQIAKNLGSRDKMVDLTLSLGESYALNENFQDALRVYLEALEGAKQLERHKDAAYLTGRIGIAHAELGQLDKALKYHEDSIQQAQELGLQELEAEQMVMLALLHLENDESGKALEHARRALKIYTDLNLDSEVIKVEQLISGVKQPR